MRTVVPHNKNKPPPPTDLSRDLSIESKRTPQSAFADGLRTVDLIAQHQHRDADYGFIRQERLRTEMGHGQRLPGRRLGTRADLRPAPSWTLRVCRGLRSRPGTPPRSQPAGSSSKLYELSTRGGTGRRFVFSFTCETGKTTSDKKKKSAA